MRILKIWIGRNRLSRLDADKVPLYSKTLKMHMKRDIVKFVPFNKFRNNPAKLTRQTLEQIP